MQGYLINTILLALATSFTLGTAAPADVAAVVRRSPSPSDPTDFHHTSARPRRVRKPKVHHKRSSAATDRAKRTPLPTPEEQDLEERQLDELLPLVGEIAPVKERSLGAGSIPVLGSISLLDLTGVLNGCSTGMTTHQAKIQQLANRAKRYKDSHMNSAFQNSVYQELKAYRGSAAGLPGLQQLDATLKPLGPDQGLANFDRNNDLEVLFRTMSTSFQDTLESINLVVFKLPVLGPVLGPILYDIKCIIDDILNIVQVILDGLLNQLSPQLTLVSGNYLVSICQMGPSLPVC
ncbi:hypothetical protein T439DRAFT_358292 [Meredithblackwellia eburnea MCA 4105]